MFFIFGVASKEKKLDFTQSIVCSNCKFPIEDGFEYCPRCGEKLK